MSELKAYGIRVIDGLVVESESGQLYLKSEADKVIANRDYEIAELKKSIGKLLKSKTEQIMDEVKRKTLIYGEGFVPVEHAMRLVAEIRHSNYKRCLAMADYAMYHHFRMLYIYGKSLDNYKAVFKINYGLRWRSRWLALAGQFTDKEAK